MSCYRPLSARKSPTGSIVFGNNSAWTDRPWFSVPCGQCIGCRVNKSRDWATRIVHEASLHEQTSFLTLTYNDENLPDNYSIDPTTLQLFNKRLRKAIGPFRFFACGEYGEKNYRPHYHMILFGHDFSGTRTPWRKTAKGYVTYRSPLLEKVWTLGHAEIGTVSVASAGYVASYCLKKITGDAAAQHYTRLNPLTGELCQVLPEFIRMSTAPGLGSEWLTKFKSDIYPSDFVVIEGKRRSIPRYYTNKLTEMEQNLTKHDRKMGAQEHAQNNSDWRLVTREEVQERKMIPLTPDLDEDL